MPIVKKIATQHGIIGVWYLTESSDELYKQCQLSNLEQDKFSNLIAERRKREFLATRLLLQSLASKNQGICYQNSGKPYLEGSSKNISISHSADYATIFISDKNIGIDVEQTTRKIDKVAKRFLHPGEQHFIEGLENQQEAKILFWSAKEAIFKCSPSQGILFNTQILIAPFTLQKEGNFKGTLLIDENTYHFNLHYLFFNNNVVTYCIEQ